MSLQIQQFAPAFLFELLRLAAWFVLLLAIVVPLERIWPLHKQPFVRRNFAVDVLYFFLSGLVPKLLLLLPLSSLAAAFQAGIGGSYYSWAADLPFAIRLAASFVAGEIGAYWAHRWSHEIPFLWRFHSVHHAAEEMDWLVNTRAHPVDLLFTRLCVLAPMFLLGLAQPLGNRSDIVPLLVAIVGTLWGYFIHANLNWRLGPFELLLSSPAFHHWHHNNAEIHPINKNFAPMLPWIDQLFGTLYLPKNEWPGAYGLVPAPALQQMQKPRDVAPPVPGLSFESRPSSN
jgi:sterol desaturase/sphingolipid hydroxylase (fatty acid hydroxylase superfamily)